MTTPFARWVAQASTTPRRGPPDDLIADLKVDDECPPIFSLRDLREYLESCNACRECRAAAKPVWQRYERWWQGERKRRKAHQCKVIDLQEYRNGVTSLK
jgi:hypothetical protein